MIKMECIENCSSCTDLECMFHEVNYDFDKIKARLEELKNDM